MELEFLISIAGVAVLVNILILTLSKRTNLFIDNHNNKEHGIHKIPTPRAGGIGIFAASIGMINLPFSLLFFMSAIPAFIAGFLEDLISDLNPRVRLGIMLLSAVASILLLDAVVYDIGYIKLPFIIGVIFTLFGVVGVINAINIIDGLNGLAAGVAVLSFSAFGYVAYLYNDMQLVYISLILIFATFGFLMINFPFGKIFLGDGGSYFLGFTLAELAILLVNRHPEISPWFPLVILIYPIWEVIFSIYRRKFVMKKGAMEPDNLHLHSLLCKRIVNSNPKTTVLILMIVGIFDIISIYIKENTVMLTFLAVLFILIYLFLYIGVVSFKAAYIKDKTNSFNLSLNLKSKLRNL
jgi:UDP-N-acetylmuramyl pentapeptide phosphotransferase/UDP-N-acetylglucosamine-1-phosphate transferase